MRLLAVDPGPEKSAVAVLENGKYLSGYLLPNEEVLRGLMDTNIRIIAIEMIASYGMPVGESVFNTCVWIGRFQQVFHPLEVQLIIRKVVTLHICNSVRAKDSNIRTAMIDRYGEVGTKKNPGPLYGVKKDIWAALAVASTAYDLIKENLGSN